MESGTLINPDVVDILNEHFVAAKLYFYGLKGNPDLELKNQELFAHFFEGSDKSAPRFVVATSTGEKLLQFDGVVPPKNFIRYLERGIASSKER